VIRHVYIAAPFELRNVAIELRSLLLLSDIICTAGWIDGPAPNDLDAAQRDLSDILRAEAVVFVNPPHWAKQGSGGRHTEIGFALANNIPVFMMGKASNVFHALPEVRVYESVNELTDALLVSEPTRVPEYYQERIAMTHADTLRVLCERVHQANKKWWVNPTTGLPVQRNVGELLMLVCSELAEAMEGHRKNLPDDKLPHRRMFDVEMADALIRILDICGGFSIDLGSAFEEKMAFNAVRVDHTLEHRLSEHGKKY
jgi:NTP pyrophosphatase (non-canonical NTP hydrolase)